MHAAFFLAALSILFSQQALADGCDGVASYNSILECAQRRSPEIQMALLDVQRAEAQVSAAGQWRNPELSVSSVQGKTGAGDKQESEGSLAIPVELGGKIAARTNVAKGELAIAQAKLYSMRAKVRAETFLKLYRLKQVLHELEIADESIATFSKLVAQYAARPQLSPEQQTSATVFRLAQDDYSLKRISILDEVSSLDKFFVLTTGLSIESVRKKLPEVRKDWSLPAKGNSFLLSPEAKILNVELDKAMAELSQARSDAWPTLAIGPSIRMQSESGQNNQLIGLNLSLSLPVFNVNGGGKAAAAASVKLSEARKALGILQIERSREDFVKVYERSIAALKATLSHQELEKRHARADQLFRRGVVASSLVIETHRSLFDLERSRNERELKALESLLAIYMIDGTILEASL